MPLHTMAAPAAAHAQPTPNLPLQGPPHPPPPPPPTSPPAASYASPPTTAVVRWPAAPPPRHRHLRPQSPPPRPPPCRPAPPPWPAAPPPRCRRPRWRRRRRGPWCRRAPPPVADGVGQCGVNGDVKTQYRQGSRWAVRVAAAVLAARVQLLVENALRRANTRSRCARRWPEAGAIREPGHIPDGHGCCTGKLLHSPSLCVLCRGCPQGGSTARHGAAPVRAPQRPHPNPPSRVCGAGPL